MIDGGAPGLMRVRCPSFRLPWFWGLGWIAQLEISALWEYNIYGGEVLNFNIFSRCLRQVQVTVRVTYEDDRQCHDDRP